MAEATHNAAPQGKTHNLVHQQLIHAETIRKEARNQKLFTEFSINPRQLKTGLMADKPNVQRRVADEQSLQSFVEDLRDSDKTPKDKYAFPLTTSQDYGWDIQQQDLRPQGEMLHRPKQTTEITRLMEGQFKAKEQAKVAATQGGAGRGGAPAAAAGSA